MKKKNKLSLSFDNFIKKFELIEKELNLDKSLVQGVPWWDMVRYSIFQTLKLELKFESIKKEKISTKKKFFIFFNRFLNYFKFLSFKSPLWIDKNNYIILGHPRRKYENGKFVDPYVDPFIELFAKSKQFSIIENEFNGRHLKPPKTKKIFYGETLSFLEFLFSIFYIRKFDKKATLIFSEIEKKIYKHFSCNIDVEQRAKLKIRKWRAVYPLMIFFFKIKKPKLLFLVNSNGHEPVIAAAKTLGITSVELQHGSPVRGKLNYDYSSGIKKSTFPDWFLSYGGFWQSSIKYPIENKRIINFGNPYLFSKISSYSHIKKEDRLVIISQTNFFAELSKFAKEAREYFPERIKIEYKPHPYEYEINDFNEMRKYGIEVSNQKKDLYEIFSKSRWQVGVSSTALYEGLYFGLSCYVLNINNNTLMDDLVKSDLAKLISSAKDIDLNWKINKENLKINNYFTKPNIKKIEFLMNKINSNKN